jgi:ribonuclease Z
MNKLIFLGTGNALNTERQLTSLCLETSVGNFLIDCGDGMGTVRSLIKANVNFEKLNDIYITHHHGDHISGMSQFMIFKLIKDPISNIRIYGPAKTLQVVKKFCFDTHDHTRDHADKLNFINLKSGQNFQTKTGLKVNVIDTESAPSCQIRGFAYGFEIGKTKIVFSSDTKANPKLVQISMGADILIHECGGLDANMKNVTEIGHSTAKEAGECAQKAGVKHLILTHFPEEKTVSTKDLAREAGQYFDGKITIAEDLMEVKL